MKSTREELRYQVFVFKFDAYVPSLLIFPSLMVHINLCSFNEILYKSLNENILDHVGIRAILLELNC
jgi:hypothetical protein